MMNILNFNGMTSTAVPNDPSKVTLTRKCPWCMKDHSITVDARAFENGCAICNKGVCIQDAFFTFSHSERNFLIAGICDLCLDRR